MNWLKKVWQWLVSFFKDNPAIKSELLALATKTGVSSTLAKVKLTAAELKDVSDVVVTLKSVLGGVQKPDFTVARNFVVQHLTGVKQTVVLAALDVVQELLPTFTAKLNVTDTAYVNMALGYVQEAVDEYTQLVNPQ